jgi:hypothetical protein
MRSIIKLTMPLFFFLPSFANAKHFSMDLSAAMGESDNALKTSENQISEKQNRYLATLRGDWVNDWLDANMQYGASKETFADDSQQGESYLQGDSQIKLGNAQSILNLDLRHSRRTLLQDVADVPTTDNQEEREIVSVMPSANFKLTGSDGLMLFADLSRTRYLETKARDADRNTYGANYNHAFTAVDSLRLSVKNAESEFIYFPAANYTMNSASLVYQVNLRKLSYSLGAGKDQTELESGEEESVPHYEASLNYKSGANSFRVYLDQSMTDSSLGQGLNFAVSDIPAVDAAATDVGLIKRRGGGIDLSTTAVCVRCELTLAFMRTKDIYMASAAESTQQGVTANLRYTFSPQALLLLSHSISDQEPLSGQLVDEYRQSLTRIAFQYRFLTNISLEIFTEKEERSSDSAVQDYTENFTGLSLAYHFE